MPLSKEEALRALALFKELLVHAEQSENIDLSISELLEDTVDTLGSPLFSELIGIQNRTHKSLKETPNWSEGVTLTPEEGFELFNRDNLEYPHTSTPNKIISHESPDPLEEELSPAQIIPLIESHTPKQEPRPLSTSLDSKPILTKKFSSTEATRSLKDFEDRMRTSSPNSKDKVGAVKIDLSHVSDKVSRSPSASKYIVSHEEEIDGVQIEGKNSSYNDLLSPMRDKRTLTDIHQAIHGKHGRESRTITLIQSSQGLGIDLVGLSRDGIFISSLTAGGVADVCGLLQIGDQILQVNERICENMASFEVAHLIEGVPVEDKVLLRVLYNPTGLKEFQRQHAR